VVAEQDFEGTTLKVIEAPDIAEGWSVYLIPGTSESCYYVQLFDRERLFSSIRVKWGSREFDEFHFLPPTPSDPYYKVLFEESYVVRCDPYNGDMPSVKWESSVQ